jgi:HEPN domain-containing protein
MSKTRIIKASKEYLTEDLLYFGIDHLRAAKFLYDASPSFYDSAGYLSHLGVELLLKAWFLDISGEHPKTHSLMTLWNKLISSGQDLSLQGKNIQWIQELDNHYSLRYPPEPKPIETGSDDWDKTEKLFLELCFHMPEPLQEKIQRLDYTKKGYRILMKKKIKTNLLK